MAEAPSSLGQRIAAVLLVLALGALPFFYGFPVNGVVFTGAVLCVLAAAAALGSRSLADALAGRPWSHGLAVFTLLILFVNYQWSLSKDSSFAPLWSVALLPLAFLVVSGLGRLRRLVLCAVVALALCFSALSIWMLFRSGITATLPLTDANNYASLLYLALIPIVYLYLHRYWHGEVGPAQHVFAVLVFAMLGCALLATQSRTGIVVVWVALSVFLLVGITRRRKLWPVVGMFILLAVLDPIVQTPLATEKSFAVNELSRGTGVRAALNETAFEIYLSHPVMGVGIGVFPLLYRQLRPVDDQDTAGLSVHNDYLQMLAEGGPLFGLSLLLFAAAVAWRFVRTLLTRQVPGPEFGALTALGAVLAHALVNFVLMTPVLAVIIGCYAAVVGWEDRSGIAPIPSAKARWGVRLLLGWGWVAFAFLLLDTHALGVYQGQTGIPFAKSFSQDLDRMLAYSKFSQSMNANRGLPVLAEAAIREVQLDAAPDSEYLQNLALHTYRRAIATDPWNPHALLRMYEFVKRHPPVADRLSTQEQPERLLLRSLSLDPMFVPALEKLRVDAEALGNGEFAYRVARQHIGKWLELHAYSDPDEAKRWLAYLREWAVRTEDHGYLAELDAVSQRMEKIGRNVQLRLWFDTSAAND